MKNFQDPLRLGGIQPFSLDFSVEIKLKTGISTFWVTQQETGAIGRGCRFLSILFDFQT